MTATEKWLTDANKDSMPIPALQWMFDNNGFSLEKDLLNPKKWQAVGKANDWNKMMEVRYYTARSGGADDTDCIITCECEEWQFKQHQFIDHLANGKTIEEALGLL